MAIVSVWLLFSLFLFLLFSFSVVFFKKKGFSRYCDYLIFSTKQSENEQKQIQYVQIQIDSSQNVLFGTHAIHDHKSIKNNVSTEYNNTQNAIKDLKSTEKTKKELTKREETKEKKKKEKEKEKKVQ